MFSCTEKEDFDILGGWRAFKDIKKYKTQPTDKTRQTNK